MHKVVSNTTPVISLLKIGKLDLLRQLYSEINIPSAVYQEIEAGQDKPFYKDLSKMEWVNIIEIQDQQVVKFFIDLDAGEAEAIVLAAELGADLIIIDEKLGRFYAKNVGLKLTGTIGILIKAKKEGFLDEIKPVLEELIGKGVWISKKLKEEILEVVGEVSNPHS